MVFVSIDNQGYKDKPKGKEVGLIKQRTSGNWKHIRIKTLANLVGNEGYTIVPAKMEGGLKAENAKAMQIITLDFDGGSRFTEIKDKAEDMRFPILFAYHTFSSTDEDERFRVVFAFDELIEDMYVAKIILQMMIKIFPECDKQCKNPDRIFFGGKELIYLNESARITFKNIYKNFNKRIEAGGHYKRNIESFCNKNHIMMINKLPLIAPLEHKENFGEIIDNNIFHIIDTSTMLPFFIVEKIGKLKSITRSKKTKKIEAKKYSYCELWNDFNSGTDIGHNGRFLLITNLKEVYGGQKKFFDILQKYDVGSYDRWQDRIKYINIYNPTRCNSEYCSHCDNCNNLGTMLETISINHRVEIGETTYYPRTEVEALLKENLNIAFASKEMGMHLIKAQTGLGKTTAYLDLIENKYQDKFIVATPTNALKQEVTGKLLRRNITDIFVTPSIDECKLIPSYVIKDYKACHERGDHRGSKDIIKNYLERDLEKSVVEECNKILEGLKNAENKRIIVTTHAYLTSMKDEFLKNYTVIIDEDILQLQFFTRTNTVKTETLKAIAGKNVAGYSQIAQRMIDAEYGYYYTINYDYDNPFGINELRHMDCYMGDNIGDLIQARTFVKNENLETGNDEVSYFCPTKLPPLKYIVLSATLNETLYREYFNSSMNILSYKEKKAEYTGKLIQYPYHSLGKTSLMKKMSVFDYACEISGKDNIDIITFKSLENNSYLKEHKISDLHFGNTMGIDKLKGKDIAIIGTFYKIESEYKLIAAYLGADVNNKEDKTPKYRNVEFNNAKFRITTYKDELLREVQLTAIQSEMEQCVGRARLLRNNCKVYLFSGFPCEQAEFHMENYLECS